MSNANRSLLLVVSVLAISQAAKGATNLLCDAARNFQVEFPNNEVVGISDAELRVEVGDGPLSINAYPEENVLQVQTDQVLVKFEGYLTIANQNSGNSVESERISESFHHKLLVTVEKSKSENCLVSLLPGDSDNAKLDSRIVNKIRHLAESCLQPEICSNLILAEEERSTEVKSDVEVFLRRSSENGEVGNCDNSEVQDTLNMFVDIGLGQVVDSMRRENGGAIVLPEVDKKFTFGSGIFESNLHFQLYNGTFRDLTTLRRRSDAVFAHKGFKFSAGCEIGLDTVRIEYKRFKVKYGVTHEGSVSGSVDGVALAIKISADYDHVPCAIMVDTLRLTRFGEMHFELTGLGVPLQWIISTVTDWMSNSLKKNIASAIEANVRNMIQSKLSNFDCEKFRA